MEVSNKSYIHLAIEKRNQIEGGYSTRTIAVLIKIHRFL